MSEGGLQTPGITDAPYLLVQPGVKTLSQSTLKDSKGDHEHKKIYTGSGRP